jgi:hypothetical protein
MQFSHQQGAKLAPQNTGVTTKRTTHEDFPAIGERPPTEANQALGSSRLLVVADADDEEMDADNAIGEQPVAKQGEVDDAAHAQSTQRRGHLEPIPVAKTTAVLPNDWIRPLAMSSKPSGGAGAMAGLIVPSINKVVGEKEEEEKQQQPIKNLLEDLSNHEKQILKQLFISNKLGRLVPVSVLILVLNSVLAAVPIPVQVPYVNVY